MENMDQFIRQILADNGVAGLDDDVMENLVKEMREYLIDQIVAAAISKLPDDKAEELKNKMEDPNFSDEDLQEFMKNSGVDLTQVALNTMLRFRNLYLNKQIEKECNRKGVFEPDFRALTDDLQG